MYKYRQYKKKYIEGMTCASSAPPRKRRLSLSFSPEVRIILRDTFWLSKVIEFGFALESSKLINDRTDNEHQAMILGMSTLFIEHRILENPFLKNESFSCSVVAFGWQFNKFRRVMGCSYNSTRRNVTLL